MADLTPNSDKFKDQMNEPAQKIIQGSVEAAPRGIKSRFKSDMPLLTKSLKDILIPSAKDLIEALITTAVRQILYKDSNPPIRSGSRYSSRPEPRTSYESIYRRPSAAPATREDYRMDDYEDLTFNNRPEADIVLNQLRQDINEYGCVSIARYYDYAGYSNDNYALRNWGWYDLNSARPYITRSGRWAIDLPRVQSLK